MRTKLPGLVYWTAALALSMQTNMAHAHAGHGLTGLHWHATDIGGFAVVLGAFTALAVLLSRKGE